MSTIDHLTEGQQQPVPSGEGLRIALAVAEWNSNITEPLLEGALRVLRAQETGEIAVMRVPGTFELVNAAARLQDWGYDAVIAIGCVVRGDTPHFDYICQGVTAGLAALNTRQTAAKAQTTTRGYAPVIFGVLTTENMQQAEERAGGALGNKGAEAAETALKMCRPALSFEFAPEA